MHHSLVIARDTAATYKGKAVDPRQVAREMGVRHVVSGSLRQEGPKILLNLALIDGETGVQRWAETFSTERARLGQTVGDFAVEIERTLAGELFRTTAERRALLSPAELTADDLAMQGFALWYRGVTRENVVGARALFERALVMDPDSVRAWAGIHFTGSNLLFNSWAEDRQAVIRRSEEAAANLERLDRDGTYTYSAKALQLFLKRDFPAVLRHNTAWTERYQLPIGLRRPRRGAHPSTGASTRRCRRSNARCASARATPSAERRSTASRWRTSGPGATHWRSNGARPPRPRTPRCLGRRCMPRRCTAWGRSTPRSRPSMSTCAATRFRRQPDQGAPAERRTGVRRGTRAARRQPERARHAPQALRNRCGCCAPVRS